MIGIGVDIVSIIRMSETITRSGNIFINRVFTEKEKENALKHPNKDVYYAAIFAAKEAVFKTFCTKWSRDIKWHDIEIQKGECGNPKVLLKGALKQLFIEKGGKEVLLSISWELDNAIAFACLIDDASNKR